MSAGISLHTGHHISDVEYFDPDDTLITMLRRAVSNAQDILLELEGGGELMVLSSQSIYVSLIKDEQRFYSAPVSDIKLTLLHKGDRRKEWTEASGRDVDEILWKAAFFGSRGRLIQGCHPVDMVGLSQWPNLTRLPHTANAPRIAALLFCHPAVIGFAARLLKIAPAEIYQFYSAAHCAGLAKSVNSSDAEEPCLKPHRDRSLLSALLAKLSKQT